MKKIWITTAAVMAIATVAIIYLRNKNTTTGQDEEANAKPAKRQKHRTQVFSKAKELSRQDELAN